METDYRFCFQENQYFGEVRPCTPQVFNQIVDSTEVARKIDTRRAVDAALRDSTWEKWLGDPLFKKFCAKQEDKQEAKFAELPPQVKLLRWTNALKQSLPCFIFGVRDFEGTRRRQAEIKHLSGLFMFDGDHLTCDPREIYERTLVPGFPWQVRLAYRTNSEEGIRLVCEWRLELGNIADNQICLARDLGLLGVKGSTGKPVVDDSCIDATRISYAPQRSDIYYIDEKHLFNI
ncbi:MAG: hypothetical protein K5945_01770 [Bacteroidaceae bacterium]|nr:hypothetical protein [Bacteroidaceae bacterium]